MKRISDQELMGKLEMMMARFSDGLSTILKSEDTLAFVEKPVPEDSTLFIAEALGDRHTYNILSAYLEDNRFDLPDGNCFLFFIKARDYLGFQQAVRNEKWKRTMSRAQIRRHMAECLLYIRRELPNCEEHEKSYLKAFKTFINERGALTRF